MTTQCFYRRPKIRICTHFFSPRDQKLVPISSSFLIYNGVKRFRPFALRRCRIFLPLTVLFLFRKPCVRFLFRTLGWYVRFIKKILSQSKPVVNVCIFSSALFGTELFTSSWTPERAGESCGTTGPKRKLEAVRNCRRMLLTTEESIFFTISKMYIIANQKCKVDDSSTYEFNRL